MALGPLTVQVRASADEWSADIKRIQRDAKALENGLKPLADPLKNASLEAKKAGDTITHSMGDANAAARGLSNMLGVQLPASVGRFISHSQTIGPALSTAFSAVAIIGVIQALGQLPAVFDKLTGAITGWDEAAKKAYGNFIEENAKAVDAANEFLLKLVEIQSGKGASLQRAIQIQEDANKRNLAGIVAINEELAKREAIVQELEAIGQLGAVAALSAEQEASRAKFQALAIEGGMKLLDLRRQLTVETVTGEKAGGDAAAKAADVAAKALQKLQQERLGRSMEADFSIMRGMEKKRLEDNKNLQLATQDALRVRMELDYARLQGLEAHRQAVNLSTGLATQAALFKRMELDFDALAAIEKARIDGNKAAAAAIQQKGMDVINQLTGDISGMFTGMIAHGQSFWEAFKNLGRAAAAGVADIFLTRMIHGFLDPFAAQLGKLANSISSKLGGLFGGGGGEGSLGSLLKGGAIAAGITAAIAGVVKLGQVIASHIAEWSTKTKALFIAATGGVGVLFVLFNSLHKLANKFVQEVQNTLTGTVVDLFGALTAAKDMGTLTVSQVQQSRIAFEKLWTDFQASAAAAGVVGQQALATMTPFVASWREWLDSLDAAAAQMERMARITDIRDTVLLAAKGWDEMEEAILSLQSEGITSAQIIAFLGSDISRLAQNMMTLGIAIPPAMQGIVDLIDVMGNSPARLRRAANAWMLPQTGLVAMAVAREQAQFAAPPITVPAMASDMPLRASSPITPIVNLYFDSSVYAEGEKVDRALVRNFIVPEFLQELETGIRGARETVVRIVKDSLDGVVSSAVVPA